MGWHNQFQQQALQENQDKRQAILFDYQTRKMKEEEDAQNQPVPFDLVTEQLGKIGPEATKMITKMYEPYIRDLGGQKVISKKHLRVASDIMKANQSISDEFMSASMADLKARGMAIQQQIQASKNPKEQAALQEQFAKTRQDYQSLLNAFDAETIQKQKNIDAQIGIQRERATSLMDREALRQYGAGTRTAAAQTGADERARLDREARAGGNRGELTDKQSLEAINQASNFDDAVRSAATEAYMNARNNKLSSREAYSKANAILSMQGRASAVQEKYKTVEAIKAAIKANEISSQDGAAALYIYHGAR